ncbi:MAG: Ig-like domain-containing protein [Gemmatimonadota bacterium]|nr:MAG: Ig-like domain-containing protein [Gemmatimonadota bacterium]
MQIAECRTDPKGGPLRVRRSFALAAAVLGLTTWLSCDDALEPVSGPAVEVQVTPAGISLSGAGATATLTVVARNANGDALTSPAVTWSSLNPHIATIDEDGTATAVASGQVTVVAEVDGQVGYALLTVSTPEVRPVTSWSARYPVAATLFGVWGTSPSDIHAVGALGTILHYDGTEWRDMTSGTNDYLYSVWGGSSSDVYAHGCPAYDPNQPNRSCATLHYDGTEWSEMAGGYPRHLMSVWGAAPTDIYAVGDLGRILHYDGASWSETTAGTDLGLMDIWGTSSSNIYAVGDGGLILHYDGAGWSRMNSGTTWQMLGVWGTSPTDVYAVGLGGTILHYDGTSWSAMPAELAQLESDLLAVWGTSSSDVYVVGWNGTVVHYDGTGWNVMTSGTREDLLDVWGTSTGVYAVGANGIILQGTR